MRFPLRRFYQDERQTLGTLAIGPVTIFTIERPWVNNQPFASCFPEGRYDMELIEIDGREKVRLHPNRHDTEQERTLLNIEISNWARQLKGCVGVGMGVRRDPKRSGLHGDTVYATTDSKIALGRLLTEMKKWPDVPMFLEVEDCF